MSEPIPFLALQVANESEPQNAPIKVNSPQSDKAKRPLAERKNAVSTPHRPVVSEQKALTDAATDKAGSSTDQAKLPAKPTPRSKPARTTPASKSARAAGGKPGKATPATKAKRAGCSEPSARRSLRA